MDSVEQKKRRKRVSANQVRIAVSRLKKGESAAKIAQELGVHFTTVHNWKNKSANRKYRTHNNTKSRGKVTPISRDPLVIHAMTEKTRLLKELHKVEKILKIINSRK